MHEWVCCHDEAANHQLPIAAAFWIIQIVSAEECSSLSKIWCRLVALFAQSFWMQWPYSTFSVNKVYCPHWVVQWSHHCSCMHIPVHSPWLSGYTDGLQTILVILTIVGLFPDKPYISYCIICFKIFFYFE